MLIKFLRYNLVQIVAYGIEVLIFFSMTWLWPSYLVAANVAGKAAAGGFAFVAHKYFTFENANSQEIGKQAGRYVLLLIANMFLGSLLLLVFVEFMPKWSAKLVSDMVSVATTFLLTHYLVFGVPANNEEGPR